MEEKTMRQSSTFKAKEGMFASSTPPIQTADCVLPPAGMAPSNTFPPQYAMENYFQHMFGNMQMHPSTRQYPFAGHPMMWTFPPSQMASGLGHDQGGPSIQPREDGVHGEYGPTKFSGRSVKPAATTIAPPINSTVENEPKHVGHMTESQKRNERRKEAKNLLPNIAIRKSQGLPPYVVETGIGGLVSGSSKGKSRFIKELRSLIERELLVGEHRWRKQPDGALAKIVAKLATTFEYKGAPLCLDGLTTRIKTILRNDRQKWRKYWCENGKGLTVNPLEGISIREWNKLMRYWVSEEAKEKSQFMKEVRSRVENPSRFGSGGKPEHDVRASIGERTPTYSVNDNVPLQNSEEVMVVLRNMELRLSAMEKLLASMKEGVDLISRGVHGPHEKQPSPFNRDESHEVHNDVEEEQIREPEGSRGVKRKLTDTLCRSGIMAKSISGEQHGIQSNDIPIPRPKTRNQVHVPVEGEQGVPKSKRSIKKSTEHSEVDVLNQTDKFKEQLDVDKGLPTETNSSHQSIPTVRRTSPRKNKELTKKDFASGDIVTMLHPSNHSMEVAVGVVQEGPGNTFHGKQIPTIALKLTMISMLPGVDPGMEIPYPDMNDDPPQDTLESLVTNLCLWPISSLRKEVNNARSQLYRSR